MIKCIIVDDEPLARSLLEDHITNIPFLEHIGSFKNAILASNFLSNNSVDLIFLDIQMPKLTGIDFLKSIPNPPSIIFTTAYREYALESYELQVVDYLLKPITFTRFFQAVKKLNIPILKPQHTIDATKDHIYVYSNKKHIKVLLGDVLYIESIKDYLKIHMINETVVIKERISHFENQLPDSLFRRVHRSYIVNIPQVTAFTHNDIEIGKIEIPIGGMYKDKILGILKKIN